MLELTLHQAGAFGFLVGAAVVAAVHWALDPGPPDHSACFTLGSFLEGMHWSLCANEILPIELAARLRQRVAETRDPSSVRAKFKATTGELIS